MEEDSPEYKAWKEQFDQYETPLTVGQIEEAKKNWLEFHKTFDHCACLNCKLQVENRCVFQWDIYNTDDDFCLMEK